MRLFRSLTGLMEIELTSGDIGRTFCAATDAGIPLYRVETDGPLDARFQISHRNLKRLLQICQKRGDCLKVVKKVGLYWYLKGLLGRPVLAIGLPLLTAFLLWLPTRILFIQVEGNSAVPSMQILEAAEQSGLGFGVSRKGLRSEQIKNSLLEKLPELAWAGVNTRGCVAVLSVREGCNQEQGSKIRNNEIVAAQDGVIESCTALRGTLLCRPGQAVVKGQLLISGLLDCDSQILTDGAEGEIFARTSRIFRGIAPENQVTRVRETGRRRQWSLILGKRHINFRRNSGISDTSCGRMYEEYYITLPGGYRLPAALVRNTYISYDLCTSRQEPGKAKSALSAYGADYLRRQMIAGTILNGSSQFSEARGAYTLQGQYLCREMIGRSRQKKIGE